MSEMTRDLRGCVLFAKREWRLECDGLSIRRGIAAAWHRPAAILCSSQKARRHGDHGAASAHGASVRESHQNAPRSSIGRLRYFNHSHVLHCRFACVRKWTNDYFSSAAGQRKAKERMRGIEEETDGTGVTRVVVERAVIDRRSV